MINVMLVPLIQYILQCEDKLAGVSFRCFLFQQGENTSRKAQKNK